MGGAGHYGDEALELLSLTLEGCPTQPPLRLTKVKRDDAVSGAFDLSASSEGIFIADFNNRRVLKVGFAGQGCRGD